MATDRESSKLASPRAPHVGSREHANEDHLLMAFTIELLCTHCIEPVLTVVMSATCHSESSQSQRSTGDRTESKSISKASVACIEENWNTGIQIRLGLCFGSLLGSLLGLVIIQKVSKSKEEM